MWKLKLKSTNSSAKSSRTTSGSGRQTLGPLHAVERLQEIKVTLQNKLMLRRTQINKELRNWIARPACSHKQVMEYRKLLELLLSMKERANGYKFKSCDEETAINVVNAQTESERQAWIVFSGHSTTSSPKWEASGSF